MSELERGWRDMATAPKTGELIALRMRLGTPVVFASWRRPAGGNWGDSERGFGREALPEQWTTAGGTALDTRNGDPIGWLRIDDLANAPDALEQFPGRGARSARWQATGGSVNKYEELERLLTEATPGPWECSDDDPWDVVIWAGNDWIANVEGEDPERAEANGKLIAAMRNALPGLLEERRELLAKVKE